jgi:exopolysaccharide biosynthesis polyprenyl glycosylphosphotransferase
MQSGKALHLLAKMETEQDSVSTQPLPIGLLSTPTRGIPNQTLKFVSGRWTQVAYLLTDIFFIALAAAVVFCLRFIPSSWPVFFHDKLPRVPEAAVLREYVGFLLLYTALTLLLCENHGLYRTSRTRSNFSESFAVLRAVIMATILLTAVIYLSKVETISRFVVALTGFLNFFFLSGWRIWKRHVFNKRVANGIGVRNVLILGHRELGLELANLLNRNRSWGYVVQGMICTSDCQSNAIKELSQLLRGYFIDELILLAPLDRKFVREVVLAARSHRVDVKLVPDLYDGMAKGTPVYHVGGLPIFALYQEPIQSLALFVKRIIDIVVSVAISVLISPVLAVIALIVKLDSSGPVLYGSRRVGKKSRIFVCYKFRTMVVNADELKENLRALNERQGPFFKLRDDPRITRVGKWLRKYSLDELPQFWNVIIGDMSLVGPRPHPIDDFEQYSLEHFRRLDVTPGITGIWQVTARQDPSFEKNMALDLEYIENWSIWTDFKILVKTIPAVFSGAGD